MCEMTSIGEMSAARTTIPTGSGPEEVLDGFSEAAGETGDLRMDLTHSLTPRLRDLVLAAADKHHVSTCLQLRCFGF